MRSRCGQNPNPITEQSLGSVGRQRTKSTGGPTMFYVQLTLRTEPPEGATWHSKLSVSPEARLKLPNDKVWKLVELTLMKPVYQPEPFMSLRMPWQVV